MAKKSTYTFEISESICEKIADGIPLRVICRSDGMPSWRTVYDWLDADKDFATRFARARLLGFDMIAQEALDIANTPVHAQRIVQSDEHGKTVTWEDALGHRKLQVETRLKLLAKWDPKRYGDKVTTEVTGADGGAIQVDDASASAKLATLLASAEARKRAQGNDKSDDDYSDLV